MRRAKSLSVRVRAPSRGLVTRLPGESADLMPSKGGVAIPSTLMSMGSFQRAASYAQNVRFENGVVCNAPGYESVQVSNSILQDVVAYWSFDSLANVATVPVTGISYVGFAQPTATVPVTPGQVYLVTPGANEVGATLVNGAQSLGFAYVGNTMQVTAQGNTLEFQYSLSANLIPPGAQYNSIGEYNATIATAGNYTLIWGANEVAAFQPGARGGMGNPGAGQVQVMDLSTTGTMGFNGTGANELVTAQLYQGVLATGNPLTATITSVGNFLDGSGSVPPNNLAVQPGVYSVATTPGKFNGAVALPGYQLGSTFGTGNNIPASGCLTCGGTALPGLSGSASGFSLAFWYQPAATGPFAPNTIVSAPGWGISQDATGNIHFSITGNPDLVSTNILTTNASAPANPWNFIAVTFTPLSATSNPGQMTLTLNGTTTTVTATAAPGTGSSAFQISNSSNSGSGTFGTGPFYSAGFAVDEMTVWSRALSALEVSAIYGPGGAGNVYPISGGPFSMIFQANLVTSTDAPTKPVLVGTNNSIYSLTTGQDTNPPQEYIADLSLLFVGANLSDGYTWTADNFNDVVILAEHDNEPQYWLPGSGNVLQPLPGLPATKGVAQTNWDGVACFQNHVLLWSGQTLQWSDLNDYTTWIPVAQTAVSAVLELSAPFTQPSPGGQVPVQAQATVAAVGSLTLSGDLTFGSVTAGTTSPPQALVDIINTGTAAVTITGVSLPADFPGSITTTGGVALPSSITINPNSSYPVYVTFSPSSSNVGSFGGNLTVTSPTFNSGNIAVPVTLGTFSLPISGEGVVPTANISLGGVLAFGNCVGGKSLQSSVVVTNTGTGPAQITGLTGLGSYYSAPGTFPVTVPAANTVTGSPGIAAIPIKFSPPSATAGTPYSATVGVTLNSAYPSNTPAAVTVTGTVQTSIAYALFLTDNGTCQFGNVVEETSAPPGTITIYNPSGNSVTISSFAPQPGYSVTPNSLTIAANSSQTVNVTFTPPGVSTYSEILSMTLSTANVQGGLTVLLTGAGISNTGTVTLSGSLNFGDVPAGQSVSAFLTIQNTGNAAMTITSINTPPPGFTCDFAGTIEPNATQQVPVTFTPTSGTVNGTPTSYSGNLTLNFATPYPTGATSGTATYPVSGFGISLPGQAALVAGQFVALTDPTNENGSGVPNYNFYEVISCVASTTNNNAFTLLLELVDTTGNTQPGSLIPSTASKVAATSLQIMSVDANEAGSAQVVGAQMNGPIWNVIPQGDYAYIFKEYSIQSVQYTGLGNGTFFIHNEVFGEGLIAPYAVVNRNDGVLVFLGHKELYVYQGGPNLVPVCQQTTQQLFAELDRSRLTDIRLFHNDLRHEIWVKYPIVGGFRVLIWNYQEDSASFDDYDSSVEFTGLGLVDWSTSVAWNQLAPTLTWATMPASLTWESLGTGNVNHAPVIGTEDGSLVIFGYNYDRDGEGYVSISETMDFDLGDPDIWKYVDTVVIGLQVLQPVSQGTMMQVQVGAQGSLGGVVQNDKSVPEGTSSDWSLDGVLLEYNAGAPQNTGMWSAPVNVLVDGTAQVPVKVNPGSAAGRYVRVRFTSSEPGVQWRVSSFEIHCRQGGLY